MVTVVFAIILVAESLVGFATGTAFKAFEEKGKSLSLLVALVGAVEIFGLAYVAGQVI